MKKIVFFFVMFSSCLTSNNSSSIRFEEIDFSFDDGWKNAFSMKILKNGNVILGDGRWDKQYYSALISSNDLFSIDTLVTKAMADKLDSTYITKLEDQSSYKFVITRLNIKPIKVLVYGDSAPVSLNILSNKLITLKESLKFQKKDTSVHFLSLENF